jgi:RNA polymerase sigma factor (sigma-70 family)
MKASMDANLFDRWIRDRDAEAFREIVERHAAMVFATARRILGDPAWAEDVAQDCFLRLAGARPPSNLAAWLHRSATNRALDIAKTERRRRERESRWSRPESRSDDPSWREFEALVDRAIDGLPEDLRGPLLLHFLEGRTHEAIAEALGIAKATVGYRISKGIEAIRAFLGKHGVRAAPALLAGWLSMPAEAAPAGLLARLGKVALAGPGAIPVAMPAPSSLTAVTGSLVLGGLMKASIAIGAALVVLAVILFIFLRPAGNEPGSRPESAARPAATSKPIARGPISKTADGAAKKSGEKIETAPEAPPPAPAPCRISGTIRDGDDRPIAFAEVFLDPYFHDPSDTLTDDRLKEDWFRRSARLATRADASGRYSFDDVPAPGEATISAFSEGFSAGRRGVQLESGASIEMDVKLEEGRTLRGIVLGRDGRPVTDAIVSIHYAWHPQDMVFDAGIGTTEGDGRFRIGLGRKAETCSIRVNSESQGQDFFFDVPVGPEEVRLQLHERATVRGRITWEDGSPAKDVLVCMEATVPEPRPSLRYSGWRSRSRTYGPLSEDGSYEIAGLQPGLNYDICALRAGGEPRAALLNPLSPRGKNRFTLAPGEVKEWDCTLSKPIIVRGTVRTAEKATPVVQIMVGLRKDGKEIEESRVETDGKGAFRLFINAGPGRYLIYPKTDFGGSSETLARRSGKTFDFEGGEEVEADLQVFEPVVLNLRVTDTAGKPVRVIRYSLDIVDADGGRSGHGSSMPLDAEGRGSLPLYVPVAEASLEVSAFPDGPVVETRRLSGNPGTILEETVVLPRTCDLTGTLIDDAGNPVAGCEITIDASYKDGKPSRSDRFGARTDKNGIFSAKGRLRASPLTLKVRAEGREGVWKSGDLAPSLNETLDLGRISLEASAEIDGKKA